MGVWNFMVDMGQSAKLSEHDDEIADLKEKVEILKDWVDYLSEELKLLKSGEKDDHGSNG